MEEEKLEKAMEKIEEEVDKEAPLDDESKNQTKMTVNMVLKGKTVLFHDQFKTAFISLSGDGRKILKLRSKDFKAWLSYLVWSSARTALTSTVIETAIRILEGYSLHEGEQIELQVRIANHDGAVWYDLGNGKAIKITENQWEIIDQPPILFYRHSHQQTQVTPIGGGNLEDIFKFMPEPPDKNERILLLTWLVTAMFPNFPHPCLAVKGPQGSRKSTLFKLLRRLIDPSITELHSPQGEQKELVQLASHHYFLPLDNISHIKPDLSDALCRIITGEGFSKRELYSDDDDVVYSFRRVIGINGINQVIDKPDLLERSILINLERPEKYEKESVLFGGFEQARSKLFGALLTAVSNTLALAKKHGDVEGLESYRMQDFARWGSTAIQALGLKIEDFVAALHSNLELQNEEVIDASPVAQVVVAFMVGRSEWSGQPTELLDRLKILGNRRGIKTDGKYFPQDANWLWRRLEQVKTNLLSKGIMMNKDKHGDRIITITNTRRSEDDEIFTIDDL